MNYRRGLVLHFAFVVAVSAAAYTGWIPAWVATTPGVDKVGHFLLIGALGFWLDGAVSRRAFVTRPFEIPLAPVLVLGAAGVEEYLQRLSPNRSSSWSDFAADVAGVVALTWLSRRVSTWKTSARPPVGDVAAPSRAPRPRRGEAPTS